MKLGSTAFALGLTFGVTVAVVACGDSDEDAKQAAAKAEAAEQDSFLDQYCQIILKCCNRVLAANISDVAGCKTRLRTLDPVTVANKLARTDCITQAKAAAPSPQFCPDFAHANTPACPDGHRKKLLGTKKVGEVCTIVDECAPAFDGIVDCKAGVCQLKKRGAENDGPCEATIDGDVVIPAATPPEGGTVVNCYLKPDGLQCDAVTGTCIKALADRKECEDSGQCAKTQYCSPEEKRCFTKLGKDQKCDVDSECQGVCKEGNCTVAVEENGDCPGTRSCVDGLECVTGICTQPGPDARLAASCQ